MNLLKTWRIRDPRYETNPDSSITKRNESFWSQDSWLQYETNPWICKTNPRFYESLIRIPHPYIKLSMGVSTVETNRDWDRERPSCQDKLLKTVEIILNVEIDFYFISVEIFKIETFSSRLRCVEIFIEIVETNPRFYESLIRIPHPYIKLSMGVSTVETNRDRDRERPSCRDKLLKTVEIILNVEIDFYFISVEIFKIETFSSRLRCVEIFIEIVETNRDFRDKSRFLDLDREVSIVETNFWKPLRLSITSRLILFWRQDRESRSRPRRDKSRPPCLHKTE
jgi:hypothetical protein